MTMMMTIRTSLTMYIMKMETANRHNTATCTALRIRKSRSFSLGVSSLEEFFSSANNS
jgi:hypothetical protein